MCLAARNLNMRGIHGEEKGQAVGEDAFMEKCSISVYFKYQGGSPCF